MRSPAAGKLPSATPFHTGPAQFVVNAPFELQQRFVGRGEQSIHRHPTDPAVAVRNSSGKALSVFLPVISWRSSRKGSFTSTAGRNQGVRMAAMNSIGVLSSELEWDEEFSPLRICFRPDEPDRRGREFLPPPLGPLVLPQTSDQNCPRQALVCERVGSMCSP